MSTESRVTGRLGPLRGALAGVGPLVSGFVAGTWFLLLWRELPYPTADQGMFVSVAERLLAGDRLYVDVFENKDPLFHYANALARIFGPWGSWVLSVALVALAAAAVWSIMRWLRAGIRASALVALVATPIILTGTFYFPGTSHLPGVVLLLWVVAGSLRSNVVLVGVTVGLLAGFKLIMLPMGVLVVLVMAVMQRRWAFAMRSGLIAGTVILVCILVMVARGEFGAYLETLGANVDYSQAATGGGDAQSIIEHLHRVINLHTLVMAVATVVLTLLALALDARKTLRRPLYARFLAAASLVLMAYSVVALALTGLWVHHAMILVPMAVIAMVLLVVTGPSSIRSAEGVGIAAILAATWLLAGAPTPATYTVPLEFARMNVNLLTEESRETVLILGTGEPRTYARVGGVDDGHAFGLRDWTLACPHFALGPLDPSRWLQDTLSCLPTADVILVSRDARDDGRYAQWTAFFSGLEDLLAAEYSCSATEGERICTRLDSDG